MVKAKLSTESTKILNSSGWRNTFGHYFRIRGVPFYPPQKVSPEIVRIAGRWRSLAYEAYIQQAFEQVATKHLDRHRSDKWLPLAWASQRTRRRCSCMGKRRARCSCVPLTRRQQYCVQAQRSPNLKQSPF